MYALLSCGTMTMLCFTADKGLMNFPKTRWPDSAAPDSVQPWFLRAEDQLPSTRSWRTTSYQHTEQGGPSLAAALHATNFYLATRSKTPNISQPLSKQSLYRPGVSWCQELRNICIWLGDTNLPLSNFSLLLPPLYFFNLLDLEHY